ncbi:hypothetical protein [Steroidobacter sp.]|uniref:hypothetical protein n=1 Tax=Steroidobacter sp. TaxID=1978227 RepID=UPI001A4A63A9|nr:hypothetical protein [Steroidobacter sp.]MBL8268566.1 hypothetical protein [Steroidobacter sp.]
MKHRSVGIIARVVGAVALTMTVALPALARPVFAIITVPVGAKAPAGLQAKIAAAREAGTVTNSLWIDSTQAKDAGFASLATLEFPNEGSYAAWTKQNAVTAPVTLKRAELLTHGDNRPRDSSKSVFKVNHYLLKVDNAKYQDFADGYIAPLMEGQRDAGLLASYAMYSEVGAVGKSQALLIAEYPNQATFDRTTPIKDALRTTLLKKHPEYAKYDPIKDSLRDSVSETLAGLGK